MTKQSVATALANLIPAKSAKQARKLAPWAAKIVKCDGGYMAFASVTDYTTWRRQK